MASGCPCRPYSSVHVSKVRRMCSYSFMFHAYFGSTSDVEDLIFFAWLRSIHPLSLQNSRNVLYRSNIAPLVRGASSCLASSNTRRLSTFFRLRHELKKA